MITEESMNKLYHLNFEKYKEDLRYLGVPLQIFKESQVMQWFDVHLNNIIENDKRRSSRIIRTKNGGSVIRRDKRRK